MTEDGERAGYGKGRRETAGDGGRLGWETATAGDGRRRQETAGDGGRRRETAGDANEADTDAGLHARPAKTHTRAGRP